PLLLGITLMAGSIASRPRLAAAKPTTELVSVSARGLQTPRSFCFTPAIGADGRFVAFQSDARDLVPGDTNGMTDVFVRDRVTDQTERVSVSTARDQGNLDTRGTLAISADGRFVAFGSDASNLVPGDTNGGSDIFVHDRVNHTTERVSIAENGAQGD